MAKRRAKKRKPVRAGIGETNWLILALLLGLISYFLRDAESVPYRFVGSYLWIAIFAVSFLLGLFYFCQFILPLDWKLSWFEGLRLSIGYNFPLIGQFLGTGSQTRKRRSQRRRFRGALPKSFDRHGAGLIPSHYSVVIAEESILSRSAGPGFVRLNRREGVMRVVDLRQHQRELTVEALTRDGIPLKGAVSLTFQVLTGEAEMEKDLAFSASEEALFQISYLEEEREGSNIRSWIDQLSNAVANSLISQLSRYTFDELYQQDADDGTTPFERIHRAIENKLTAEFGGKGVDINGLTVKYLDPPAAISTQRIENWRSSWRRRKMVRDVESEVQVNQRIQHARAQAQIEIVGKIASSIEQMRRRSETELADLVAMRMVDAMDEVISDDAVTSLVALDTPRNLDEIERWIRGMPSDDGSSSNLDPGKRL